MDSGKTLILLAHGSRSPETPVELRSLALSLQAAQPGLSVRGAFLSLGEPNLESAFQEAVQSGAREITVLPLFLFSGKHMLEDIPALMAELGKRHPGIRIFLKDSLHRLPGFTAFLLDAGGFGESH